MSDLKAIKNVLLQELQDSLIEILLCMKKQIFDDLVEYFSGTGKSPQRITAPVTAVPDAKCEATLTTGQNKGSKCPNRAKDNTPFCGRHKKAIVVDKEGKVQQPRRCKAIIHNYTPHKKQCEHFAKPDSSFCGVHKSHKPNGLNAVPEAFATLQDRDESIRKLREAQPYLDRLKEEGVKIPIPADCVAVPSTHPDMFERGRENLAREIKQEVAELRVVVGMKEKEEKETETLLDQLPTEEQVREAEESGMIPRVYRKWNIQCRMVNKKMYPILPNGYVEEAWKAIRAMVSQEEYDSLKKYQVKHPHIHEWKTIVNIGCYCQKREKYNATPNRKKDERYELTINGGMPQTNKQKLDMLGLKMRIHEEELKEKGLPYVPSDVAAKMPNERLEERRRKREPEEFFDPSDHPYYETNTIQKTIYVHKRWDYRDDKLLEKLKDGQRVKRSTFSNNLVIKDKDTAYEGEVGGYDSDCSKASVAEDYFPKFIECLTPRSKKYEVWNSRARH